MAYISNILTHWVGKGKEPEEQYNILTQKILKQKELRFGKCKLSVLSKYQPDCICEMISFTDIPFSECESHCEQYSKFGISFKKAYLANLHASPIAYLQNPAFHGNLNYIFSTLEKLNDILIEKNGSEEFDLTAKDTGHTIKRNTLPLLTYLLSYYEEYDKDKEFPYTCGNKDKNSYSKLEAFFENTKAGYFEREWRLILNSLLEQDFPDIITSIRDDGYKYFKFEEKHIEYIIMPKAFICRFKEESNNIFSDYQKENIPRSLVYEDLKYI